MTHQRTRIREFVSDHPGIHFNELTRALDLAPGQVQYHLKKLKRKDAITEESLYGRTHYYTPDYGPWERGALAVLRRETARDILVYLMTNGPSTPGIVADGLNIARSTLEWHLDHLVEQELVDKQRDTQNHITLVLSHPEETARMLRLVEPSVADRLVDRFTRLVDGLLAGEPDATENDS
ncbi:ArsR family transcriptional regulator [Haloglomus irregulare]|jgi:predicted transcriptional regulator|uniref:ArsR family transcriptional regulator n=1 Tax=Haloglomus irregulare TaxID=2234134 RepID=A0A554MTR5_9EURY|nr:winged helix-turn-helix transcriptional regulator [Haloglomus irregulare]TSD08528.1 ArsR family transcriptional regulator [Haloglomus irregulare]